MIRQIAVPPFDLLAPYLPGPARVDFEVQGQVATILREVAAEGDAAVRRWTLALDGVDLEPADWLLPRAEWDAALDRIDPELREALEVAVDRVTAYHRRQRERGFSLLEDDGTLLGMRVTPLERVGLYVPGGKAAYPSSVIMNAVPAVVAGVEQIVAVTPPGGVTDAVLAACRLAGVTQLYRIGGAQAVGALAYGTRSLPRVDKVVGPGNKWVAEAKRQVSGLVGIDMIAGPTELIVLADAEASPEQVAADMVAQAEHDEDATAWCVTSDAALADVLPAAIEELLPLHPRAEVIRAALSRQGLIVWVPTMQDGVDVVNRRAPEHLEIIARDAEKLAESVQHAGAIFLGQHTPTPVGDYLAGPSHVLPTGGTARHASPLGVYDFIRRTSIIHYSRDRLLNDAPSIIALAEAEGLVGHAHAIRIRL
ncbi:MAG: histidinol dehydrogenase [Gemmatimonadota bacterium]|nr:histidinol dehydrogenase [Gemmatimonadota bacterium]MDH4347390.1 histidinol dehydrogenase [Gemmatimonadota bacterium]MDH5284596.1 histidinol dehydrogenase [Gemmatimonadota bacterium]